MFYIYVITENITVKTEVRTLPMLLCLDVLLCIHEFVCTSFASGERFLASKCSSSVVDDNKEATKLAELTHLADREAHRGKCSFLWWWVAAALFVPSFVNCSFIKNKQTPEERVFVCLFV